MCVRLSVCLCVCERVLMPVYLYRVCASQGAHLKSVFFEPAPKQNCLRLFLVVVVVAVAFFEVCTLLVALAKPPQQQPEQPEQQPEQLALYPLARCFVVV